MADAARGWLDRLDAAQRTIAVAAVPVDGAADIERRRWFYTPTDHGGLTFHQQQPGQQQAAMRLLASGLSEPGYVTVATVIGLENVLNKDEGFGAGARPERYRDPGRYYLRVFGVPGDSGAWGWRFGGHHVSLNFLVVDGGLVATTPCFLGANPATSPLLGGVLHRPLGGVEDLARELVRSLHPDLAHRAVLPGAPPPDLVTSNLPAITPGAPEGVRASDLDRGQREVLRALLASYFDRVPPAASPLRGYDDAALDAVHFAWAGPTEPGTSHYYRVQGPRLLIEWDNTPRNGNHAHSVWRDPDADFGMDVLRQHRLAQHGQAQHPEEQRGASQHR